MKKTKRILALVLMFAMLLQLPAMAFAQDEEEEAAQPEETVQLTEDILPEEPAAAEPEKSETDAPNDAGSAAAEPEVAGEEDAPSPEKEESTEPSDDEETADLPESEEPSEEDGEETPEEAEEADDLTPEGEAGKLPEGETEELSEEETAEELNEEPTEEGNDLFSSEIGDSGVLWALDGTTLVISGCGTAGGFSSADEQPWAEYRTMITEVVFDLCEGLNVTDLSYWFDGCSSLQRITIPFAICHIGTRAFAGCAALTDLSCSAGCTVADDAFLNTPWYEQEEAEASEAKPAAEPNPGEDTGEEAQRPENETEPEEITEEAEFTAGGMLGMSNFCEQGIHSFTELVSSTPATCTSGGTEVYACFRQCGATQTKTTPALGHNWYCSSSKAPTCTSDGYNTYSCSRCGASYTDSLGARGHAWGAYTYAQHSHDDHLATRWCSQCGAEDAAYQGHAYNGINGPVCTKCGYKRFPDPYEISLSISAGGYGTDSCTGYVDLSWNAVSDAAYYYVCIFNGSEYEFIDVGSTTSWTSAGQGIWPTEEETAAGRYALHTDGGGSELYAVPAPVYANAGGGYGNDVNYYFAVIPANEKGYATFMDEALIKNVRLPDTVPPSVPQSITTSPEGWNNHNESTVTWAGIRDYNGSTISDSLGTGSVYYRLDSDSEWTDTGSNSGSGSILVDTAAFEDGVHVIYIRSIDENGNTSAVSSAEIKIDRTAPNAPDISVSGAWTKEDALPVTWSGITDLSGLSRVEYSIDEGEYISTGHTEEAFSEYPLDVSSLSDGVHTVKIRGVDLAGNTGPESGFTIFTDKTAPEVSNVALEPLTWTNQDTVAVSWEALTDHDMSGVKEAYCIIDGGEKVLMPNAEACVYDLSVKETADGEHTVLVTFEDAAGNTTEHTFTIYTDKTAPELELLSPETGMQVNGAIAVLGSANDPWIEEWTLSIVRADGSTDEIKTKTGNTGTESVILGTFNCKNYEDHEALRITLTATDKAGNVSTVYNTVEVNKRAIPLEKSIEITAPADGEALTSAVITGAYEGADSAYLYIDGEYDRAVSGGEFPFKPIRYEEGSTHRLSIISLNGGVPLFSKGLARAILLSESFDESTGASYESESAAPETPVMGLWFSAIGAGGISYSLSVNGGAFTPISDGAYIPVTGEGLSTVQVRAEGISDPLSGYTLYGITEMNPVAVKVKLLKDVSPLDTVSGTVMKAYVELASAPGKAAALYQYIDSRKVSGSFTLDALGLNDNETYRVSVLSQNSDGTISATDPKTVLLVREDLGDAAEAQKEVTASAEVYAIRLDALGEDAKYWYSTDGSTWQELTPGSYAVFNRGIKTLYFKAEGTALEAWHIEGVASAGSSITPKLVCNPVNVTAKDWGDYYENEKLRRYELTWEDPTGWDDTAYNSTVYEVCRNGIFIGTAEETAFTDFEYEKDAVYIVRTVRRYEDGTRYSSYIKAETEKIPAPVRVSGVTNDTEEIKQSEYLNYLYGGGYTLSDEANPPHDEIVLTVLGEIDLCANGLEPVNFATGNFYLTADDYEVTSYGLCDYVFERTYNTQYAEHDGPFGKGWESELSSHLTLYTGGDIVFHAPGGANVLFERNADGSYSGGEAYGIRLTAGGSEYTVTDRYGDTRVFTSGGLLKAYRWHDGNEAAYLRDEDGLITALLLPDGAKVEITMDRGGHVTQITTLGGSTLTYTYSEEGRLVSFTDPAGAETKYEYDACGRMTKWFDANGNCQVVNEYDGENRVIHQQDANGSAWDLTYGEGHTVITDCDGNASEVWYDENYHTTRTVDAEGGTVCYTYNGSAEISSVTDGNGQTTLYEYDSLGHKTKETHPDGSFAAFEYDGRNLVKMTDECGGVTEYVYDENNCLILQRNPDGGEIKYTYNENSQVLSITDALGGVTTNEYAGSLLKKTTDALGNVTEYSYDGENRLISEKNAAGAVTAYEYDAAGNPEKIIFADGSEVSYTYDAAGYLTSETDALGNVTHYTYDAGGNVTSMTDAAGGIYTMELDRFGNIISVQMPNGGTAHGEYDALGRLLKETDPLGNSTEYEYDANGNLTAITDANGLRAEMKYDARGNLTEAAGKKYRYDEAGRLIKETAANGCITEYFYNKNGTLAAQKTNGNRTAYEYDAAGNIVSAKDAEGRTVHFTYDLLGNMLEVIYPDGTKDIYSYDALSRLTSFTPVSGVTESYSYDCIGNVTEKRVGKQLTSYEYDLLGRNTAVITQDGARTEYTYDALGNRISETDALGNVTEYTYDSLRSLKEIVYANGATVKAEYDLAGRMTGETDAEGNTKHYGYDAAGRLISVEDALGHVTAYEYDSNDNLSKVTDALGHVTEYESENGNLLSETDALGNTVRYSYTPEGWLASETDGEGNVTKYGYDRTGRLISREYADGSAEEIIFTPVGQLSVITDGNGTTVCLYDDGGKLICVREPDGSKVEYTYDEYGNRSGITYLDGKTAQYTYDDMNRLVKVKGTDGKVTKYTYDELGRRILTKGQEVSTAYEYDSVGNLVSQTSTGSLAVRFAYTYDKTGRITGESRTENGVTQESRYAYDAAGQLMQWNAEHYTYDAAGNMLTKGSIKYTYNEVNQLISDGVDKYSYDRNGNLTQKGDVQYTYNAKNLLESYTDGEYTETYTYNAQGLLKSISAPNEVTTFTWDILNGDGQMLTSTANGVTTDYTYGLERISGSIGSSRTEYVYDARGSVIAEVSAALSGNTVTEKSYSPFGEVLTGNSTGFGYNGEYYNAATGMIYLRARFYAPEMSRFSQKDILRGNVTSGISLNRYLYCGNDPVNYIDPSGMRQVENINPNKDNVSKVIKTNNAANARYTETHTPTPASNPDAQRPTVKGNTNAPECNEKGVVYGVDIHALGAGDYGYDRDYPLANSIIDRFLNSIELELGIGMGFGGKLSVGPLGLTVLWSHDYIDVELKNKGISISQSETSSGLLDLIFVQIGKNEKEYTDYDNNIVKTERLSDDHEADLILGPDFAVYIGNIGISGRLQINISELITK